MMLGIRYQTEYAVSLVMYLPVLSSLRKSCFGIDVYLDLYKEKWQQTWKGSLKPLRTGRDLERSVTKTTLSLTVKYINVFSVKTKVIVIPGLPDLWGKFQKVLKGAQYEVNLMACFMFLISYLILNITPFSSICSADSWLGSPVLTFENVPSFPFFLYSTLYTC